VYRALRKLRPEPYTYLVLLTAKDAKESVVEGLESGADDYLTKPFNPQELKARIRVGLRLLELEDKLVQAREAMRFKATHDTLTGVWNRGAILETLDREVWRSRREGRSVGVLIWITSRASMTPMAIWPETPSCGRFPNAWKPMSGRTTPWGAMVARNF
jgi:PleD family two-component response regulator